jgi:hypothetical protein
VDATSAAVSGRALCLNIRPHPLFAGDPLDARYIRVSSTGSYRGSSRVVSMDFLLDKKIRFAMVGKVPIQLGRNVMVEGPIGMTVPGKYPPIYALSDFKHLNSTLGNQIDSFNGFLKAIHRGYDNRISVSDPDEAPLAAQAGYKDTNGDNFIDEYDLFLAYYDRDKDKAISASFTTLDRQDVRCRLFATMDALGRPLTTTEGQRDGIATASSITATPTRKCDGQISLATTPPTGSANLKTQSKFIQDLIAARSPRRQHRLPLRFAASPPPTSSMCSRRCSIPRRSQSRTGPEAATDAHQRVRDDRHRTQGAYTDRRAGDACHHQGRHGVRGGGLRPQGRVRRRQRRPADRAESCPAPTSPPATANEKVPFGSTAYQATYARPVFRNMKFKNVRIPKGMNALFDNCTFEGVTYVEMQTNITTSSGATTRDPNDGMTWSKKMKSGTFSADTALTATNSYGFVEGNNLRFNNCTMKGPVATDNPTAYTHFTNSMEFTGATMFDNQADQTATIVAPQTNIEMGSFTDPSKAPSTLVGVVVAGNIDIRGSSKVDGSIIVTGDGAGSTTMGWFGPERRRHRADQRRCLKAAGAA